MLVLSSGPLEGATYVGVRFKCFFVFVCLFFFGFYILSAIVCSVGGCVILYAVDWCNIAVAR